MDVKELTSEQFQEELNRWFQDRGIIADLRSHLRHLMITALQNTQIGLKPMYKTSPKSQALDLLLAEYLLSRGCHYTLSVFTSEVPTLKSFAEISPGLFFRNRKKEIGAGDKSKLIAGGSGKKDKPNGYFKESEVEELLNALGLTSSGNEIKILSESYLMPENEESLLECLLKIIPELSTKLLIRQQTLQKCQADGHQKGLSAEWSSQLTDILMELRIKPYHVTSAQEAISKITESEILKMMEEENKKQMEMLMEREKRIQDNLKKHEEELLSRLKSAEEEFKSKREIIDEELSQRQRHLSKMASVWKDRHDEIIRLSVNIHDIKSENQNLQTAIEEMEAENQELNYKLEAQNKIIAELQGQMGLLVAKLKSSTESNAASNEKIESMRLTENKVPSPKHRSSKQHDDVDSLRKGKPKSESSPYPLRRTKSSEIPNRSGKQSPFTPICFQSSEEEKITGASSDFSTLEEVVAEAWERFRILEEESKQVDSSYLYYKKKYCSALSSDSESSKNDRLASPKKLSILHNHNAQPSTACIKSPQHGKENKECEEIDISPASKKTEIKPKPINKKESPRKQPIAQIIPIRLPTKRQLKDHSYFLKSRSMLGTMERDELSILKSSASSTVDTSIQYSSSNDSETPEKKHVSFKKTPASTPRNDKSSKNVYESSLLTPLRTASFYCNPDEVISKVCEDDSGDKFSNLQEIEADSGLQTLKEIEIKSAAEEEKTSNFNIPLRQQILMSDSDEDSKFEILEKISQKNYSPKSEVSQAQQSDASGNISVGKQSASDEDFWT